MNKWFFDYQRGVSSITDNNKFRVYVDLLDQATVNAIISEHNKGVVPNGQQQDHDLPDDPRDVT